MQHSVQIDPEKCVLVMGPQMAAEALSLSEGVPAALSYAMLVNIGIQKALDLDKKSSSAEKARRHALLVNAYELEPAFAAFKVVEALKEKNMYQEWLTELFGSLPSLHAMSSSSRLKQDGVDLVEQLTTLQEKGVLLVYTHFDNILDVQMGTEPVLLQDEEAVHAWGLQRQGILHVHGLFSKPESVTYDCVDYRRLVGDTPGGVALKEVFRGRSIIFAGFDGEFYDPFLPKFAQTFLGHDHPPPLLLSAAPKVTSLTEAFLSLKVPELRHLDKLMVTRPPAAHLGCTRDSVESKLTTTLLYSNKANCLEAAELVKVTSAVNVHQLTMRHESSHHLLLLYLDKDGLKELWKLIFATASPSQPSLHAGLLGVVLDDAVTVWLDGGVALAQMGGAQMKQSTSGGIISLGETSQGVAQSLHMTPSFSAHPTPPLSLSTSVALIGSTWTPIPAPSISRPLSTASSASTSAARVGHTSPLVSSTSRTSQGTVATRGPLSDAHHFKSGGPSHRTHHQVRRAQSERMIRQGKQSMIRNKNGLLVHRESAPEFVQTSEGLVAYPSNPSNYRERAGILIGQPRSSLPSSSHHGHHQHHIQPSPLVKGGAHMDVKTGVHMDVKPEIMNAQRTLHAMPTSKAATAASSLGSNGGVQFKGAGGSRPVLPSRSPGLLGKEFHEEKQKFITEAQSWSKQVDSDLAKKIKSTSSAIPLISTSSSILTSRTAGGAVGGAYPMGFVGAPHPLVAAQPSLTSKFSPEEQEKLLKQHFDQTLQQQQLLLSSMGGLPLSMPINSPAKSPVGPPTASSSISALAHAQQQQQQQPAAIPLATPLAAPSSSGAVASPKKTSPLSVLQQATANPGASPLSVFPFLPTSGNTAGLLCNPSLTQYPMAAMFNPVYQAALQNLIKSGQVPGVSPDPALFQGMMDKVPVVLGDGNIAFVPLGGGASPLQGGGASQRQGGGDTSPAKDTAAEDDEQDDEEEEQESRDEDEDGDTLRSPVAVGYKRTRSPGVEAQLRGSLPKRRRSSSLPDINHLLHISPHKKFHEEVGEDIKEKSAAIATAQEKKSNGITTAMVPPTTLGGSSPRPRQQAPPTMIHIPQDMKIDPMLGFPTPPQSSPLRGAFSLSPVVLPSVQYHTGAQQHSHQPMTPVTPQDQIHPADEFRELVESGELSTTLPPSPEGSALPPFPAGRGPIQLWQFLLDLLLSPDKQHMIHWTGNGYEFCIILPEDIAKLWGARKNKPRMNYDKLSRGLRYYYNKGIMDKVQGKKLTFKYTCDVHHYIRSRNAQSHPPSTPHATPTGGEYRSGSSTPVMMHVMGDRTPEGDEGQSDDGGVAMLADRSRLYGSTPVIPEEMELAPAPGPGYHQRIKKAASSNMGYGESESARCDLQGLMGMVKGYGGVLSVVGSESHGSTDRLQQQHASSLCSEAV